MWYGEETIDDRLMKLLPNHYLDVLKREKTRIPFYGPSYTDENDLLDYSALVLKNTYVAVASRYNLMQPVTAG